MRHVAALLQINKSNVAIVFIKILPSLSPLTSSESPYCNVYGRFASLAILNRKKASNPSDVVSCKCCWFAAKTYVRHVLTKQTFVTIRVFDAAGYAIFERRKTWFHVEPILRTSTTAIPAKRHIPNSHYL